MKKKRTASQVGKMSRRKGKSFERWVARYFSKWTGLKWETTRNSGRTDLRGDIYCVSRPDLPLVVECKHRKEYSAIAMIKSNKAIIKLITDNLGKMLIVKNDVGIWVFENEPLHPGQYYCDSICSGGNRWFRLGELVDFEVEGVKFRHDS